MSKLVKDYLEIKGHGTLDALIARLVEVRDTLPQTGQVDVKLRGDDVFGRHLCVSFMREQTVEEADCDARYAHAYEESLQREAARLENELGSCDASDRPSRPLRIAA